MGTGLEVALIVAAVSSVAATTYSVVQAEKAEDKQEEAIAKQEEQTRQASAMEAENQKRAAQMARGTQRARLAQAGVTLDEEGSTSEQLSADIQSDLTRNLTTLGTQQDWQLQNLESQRSLIPSASSAAIAGGLNLAGTLAGSYAGYKTAQTNQALLARPVSQSLSSNYTFSGGASVPTTGLLGTYKLQ